MYTFQGDDILKFIVDKKVFEKLPDICFGVVVGYGIDNKVKHPEISKMLEHETKNLYKLLDGKSLKEHESITPYREAFVKLGINPNKYMSSIEAMAKRVAKGNLLPSINGIVDLANAISLKYILPMGAHDVDALEGNLSVRFAAENDIFIPLGSDEIEKVDINELVYADNKSVRTRRWIWRQSDRGKISEESENIFFPIDGFENSNKDSVIAATNLLADLLHKHFKCKIKKCFINSEFRDVEII